MTQKGIDAQMRLSHATISSTVVSELSGARKLMLLHKFVCCVHYETHTHTHTSSNYQVGEFLMVWCWTVASW